MRAFCHVVGFVLAAAALAAAQQPAQAPGDWKPIEQILGRSGSEQGGVHKFTFPRSDLSVRVGRTRLEPGAALTSWVAFRQDVTGTIMAGDIVLLPSELDDVLQRLQGGGLEITAVHNHLAAEKPRLMYAHFFGRGEPQMLARAFRHALEATATPLESPPPQKPERIPFDRKTIEEVLGTEGRAHGLVLSFSFPRPFTIASHQVVLPPAMGVATAINFQPSPAGVAATGDFVLRDYEVNAVTAELLNGGASVCAIHNHLLDDHPKVLFLHFWIEGKEEQVAKTLERALQAAP